MIAHAGGGKRCLGNSASIVTRLQVVDNQSLIPSR